MPVLDEGDIIVQLEKSPSISLSASVALDTQIQRALLEGIPEIRQIVARTGSDEIGLDPMGLNETDVFMELKPASEWRFDSKEALIESIREVLQGYPGINIGFTQPIAWRRWQTRWPPSRAALPAASMSRPHRSTAANS